MGAQQKIRSWLKALLLVEDGEKKDWIINTLRPKYNLPVFGRYFFPHIIYESIPDCQVSLIGELASKKDSTVIFPRGFGKTTWEKIDTLHDIVYATEPVILYISSTLQDAGFHFESMKSELENNEILRSVYGDLVPQVGSGNKAGKKWTSVHFETKNGVNIIARGAGRGRGVNIKNCRPTKIIIDDAETDEQVHSDMRRQKYHDWLSTVVVPSLDKRKGRIKMIGTVIHPECELLKFYGDKGGLFRKAIENDESIWEKYWSKEDLFKLRDGYTDENGKFINGIGLRAFSQEYLNEPINDDTVIFKREWLDKFTYESVPDLSRLDIKMAVDPNVGQSQMADFMGVCVMGRDRITGQRYVLDASRFKGPIEESDPSKQSQVTFFDGIYTKWNPIVAGIESLMLQRALFQVLSAKGKYRVRQIDPKGRDKVARAQYVEPLVAQGTILFSPSHVSLYNELVQFPNGAHDDMVDAFLYVNSLFDNSGVKLSVERSPMITAGLHTRRF